MPRPDKYEAYARRVAKIYADSEAALLREVTQAVKAQLTAPDWDVIKLTRVRRLRAKAEAEVARLGKTGAAEVRVEVAKTYNAGLRAADKDLRRAGQELLVKTTWGVIHEAAVDAIALKTVDALASTHFLILRAADDAYRQILADAAPLVLTGTHTREQATQAALRRFADRGIGGFTDRAGRVWQLADYVEMATRTATGQAAVEGHLSRMTEQGRDLVVVSYSPEPCPLCVPFEGKILSVSGRDDRYLSVADARRAGLWHPNCTHTVGAYVPGLTRVERVKADPETYRQRQKQRYHERQIRRWRRREAAALTDDEAARAGSKVQEWQRVQNKFLWQTGRRRRIGREQV